MRTRRRLSDRAPEGYDERDGELQDEAVEEGDHGIFLAGGGHYDREGGVHRGDSAGEIGASGPQNLARSGARSSVAISLMMFDSRAMVPSSARGSRL